MAVKPTPSSPSPTEQTWDTFTRITLNLFTPEFLAGASVLLSQNDQDSE